MRYLFLCIVLLPCLWAAEIQNIFCPDGTLCPFGKTCCIKNSSRDPGCCDLLKDDLENKRLVPALPPIAAVNVSMAPTKKMHAYCPGTQCGINCIQYIVNGVCCSDLMYACPNGARCCSDTRYQVPWCCARRARCHSTYGYCIGGAASTSVAIVSVLLAVFLGMTSKHFL